MNYRVQFVNIERRFTTIQIYPDINKTLQAIQEIMNTASHKYKITITTKPN